MRTKLVVPFGKELNLTSHGVLAMWHDDFPCQFIFQGANETLDDGNTPVLAHRAETRSDLASLTM